MHVKTGGMPALEKSKTIGERRHGGGCRLSPADFDLLEWRAMLPASTRRESLIPQPALNDRVEEAM
jgi:hypothetical protein